MTIIKEIEKQYFEIEEQYSANEFKAHNKGFFLKEEYWRKKRDLNTHAYFLFLFTRLEDHIRIQSNRLIKNKQENIQHWKTKAIWDNVDLRNIHFKKRVALLTEKGVSDYNRIIEYYKIRNKIGHGEIISDIGSEINMINVFMDMRLFFKKLRP